MGRRALARKSTNSNKSKNKGNGDSLSDSGESDVEAVESAVTGDEPVVIDGKAEDVTDSLAGDVEAPEVDADADQTDEDATTETDETEAVDESAEPEAEITPAPIAPPPAAESEPERGSVMPLVIGGIVAGAIGYGASHFGVLNQNQAAVENTTAFDARFEELRTEIGTLSGEYSGLASEVAGLAPADTAPLTERLDTLSSDVEALRNLPTASQDVPAALVERIETLETDITGQMASLNERIGTLETDITGQMVSLNERISGLEDRLSDMQMAAETAPDPTEGMSDEQLANFQSELEQLTAQATAQVEQATAEVNAAKERASEFEKQAAEAAALAERKTALAALTSAVENGTGFVEELAFFDDAPKALTATAEAGVPTLNSLQRDFPDVARAALATATVVPQDASATDRLTAFLKRQTNARSLAPKEGDSVDAVLSRAEAKVSDGDLPGSLKELSTLPEEAKNVLGPWIADAQSRLDALAALSEISAAEN